MWKVGQKVECQWSATNNDIQVGKIVCIDDLNVIHIAFPGKPGVTLVHPNNPQVRPVD